MHTILGVVTWLGKSSSSLNFQAAIH